MARSSRTRRRLACSLLALAACGRPLVDEHEGESDESTGSTGEAETESSSSGAPSTTASESSATPESSSESGSDESSSSGEAAVCGDGVEHPDELCDDGNRIDEDGCNADCVPSGSLVWEWEPPAGEFVQRIDYGPDDHLWV